MSTHITVVWKVWAAISHNYIYSFHLMWPILSKMSTHITVVWEVWAEISHNYIYSFHLMWPILSKMSTHITIVWEVLARMKISTHITKNSFHKIYEHSYHKKLISPTYMSTHITKKIISQIYMSTHITNFSYHDENVCSYHEIPTCTFQYEQL